MYTDVCVCGKVRVKFNFLILFPCVYSIVSTPFKKKKKKGLFPYSSAVLLLSKIKYLFMQGSMHQLQISHFPWALAIYLYKD